MKHLSVDIITTVDTLPAHGTGPKLVFLSTDQKYYLDLSTGWEAFPAAAGAVSIFTKNIDVTSAFSQPNIFSTKVTITAPGATIGCKVIMTCEGPSDGRQFDEMEMDGVTAFAYCEVSDQLVVAIHANPGPISGTYKFNYILG